MYIYAQFQSRFVKECNKVSIASVCCSALVRAEQFLRTTIVRNGGSHGRKQTYVYLLLYWTSSRASSVTASLVCRAPRLSEMVIAVNTSPFLETAISSSKMEVHTSPMCSITGAAYYAQMHH